MSYVPNLDTALNNLSNSFDSLLQLVGGASFVIGVFLVVKGLMLYRSFGMHMASQGKQEHAAALVAILVGAVLIYLPTTINTGLQTIFGTTSTNAAADMIGYSSIATTASWRKLMNVLQNYIQLIGYIAFVRGWLILSKLGHAGGQPGNMGKGLTHIIAGIILVNIVASINILANTFGFQGV